MLYRSSAFFFSILLSLAGVAFARTTASSGEGGPVANVSRQASLTARQNSSKPIRKCSDVDPSYVRTANDTGGLVWAITPADMDRIGLFTELSSSPNMEDLLAINDVLAGANKTYTVPIDSTVTRASFSASCASSFFVKRPDGSIVQPTDADVRSVALVNGAVYVITNPLAGVWSIVVNGEGPFSLRVGGRSSIDFASFRFLEIGGRPGHEGYFPIEGYPLLGKTAIVGARVSVGDARTAQFELRSDDGMVLGKLDLREIKGPEGSISGEFYGEIELPRSPFRAYLTGTDANGRVYQRLRPAIVRPQTVRVDAPADREIKPGQIATYIFRVTNSGAADTFRFIAFSDKNFLRSTRPQTFRLGPNETADIKVELHPPADTPEDTLLTLTVTVQSMSNPDTSNYAVVESHVTPE